MNTKEVIKKILKEETSNESITRIVVFDFDGTLVNSPLPENGRLEYKEKTGQDWPYQGWWGRPESLDTNIFDIDTIPSVISAYRKERSNLNTLLVMLTGRIKKLSTQVEAILNLNGLKFDVYEYNNGGSTLTSKINTLDNLLKVYPNVKSLSMFDDRVEHIDAFKAWGAAHDNINFDITVVDSLNK
jgi:hypothetical protein